MTPGRRCLHRELSYGRNPGLTTACLAGAAELRIFDMKQRTMSFGQRIAGDYGQIRANRAPVADEMFSS